MTDKIKQIVSAYTEIPIDQLHPETQIGRSAVSNSIILHRMYGAIAKEGFEIPDYQKIQTFGELINKTSGIEGADTLGIYNQKNLDRVNLPNQSNGIGIDIEEISKMPRVNDFREEPFYIMNFTPAEIAYCVLQPDQYASFTGLFAAKEAIIKADNGYKKVTFNKMFIDHLPGGQPVFNDFNISISHVGNFSVAVAIRIIGLNNTNASIQRETFVKNNHSPFLISLIAIIIAIAAICMVFFK